MTLDNPSPSKRIFDSMPDSVKRRRLNAPSYREAPDTPSTDEQSQSITELETDKWNGFCEIESEPALFNVMLRDFGVKGVKVQEVVSLDEEMMAFIHKPVYGFIFLFRWREDDPDKQEASCPEGLWFANQTVGNACASVALLNIVNNIEGADLGENLQHFKDFTMSFTPALRGDAINNFEFVKRVHNSFARTRDMRDSDLQLKNEATSRRSRSNKKADSYENDAGFHFIAFVPVMGKVWKFDGLERQPQALGDCSQGDWLDLVKPNILTRMAACEEGQHEFSLLSLVKDPLVGLVDDLAVNVKGLEAVNGRIAAVKECQTDSEPTLANSSADDTVMGPDESLFLTREAIDHAEIPANQQETYQTCLVEELKQHRQTLRNEQQELRVAIREEQQSQQSDVDYATGRRYDYGRAVATWMGSLAHKGVIEELL